MKQISPNELHQLIQSESENLFLLDVREKWEFDIARLEQSINIPMSQIPSFLNELDEEQTIICICHHGIRSMHVCNYLMQAGFDNVINLTGGIDKWSSDVDPNVSKY